MSVGADILLGAFRAEDRDRDYAPLREIIAVDARANLVAQPDGLGALHEAALRTLLDQRETTAPLPQEVRCARTVGEQRLRAGQEDEARLVIARRGRLRADAGDVAKRACDLDARKQRRQRRQHDAV